MVAMKTVTELPEWFIILPNDAKLVAKDVMELFGFRSHRTLAANSFPKPDGSQQGHSKFKHCWRPTWSKQILLYEIERRKNLS